MSAYEIGTKVLIERTHEEGVISGVGQIDWDGSTSGVYGVDVGEGPQKVVLVHEEDLTIPDQMQDVAITAVFKAKLSAETWAIAIARFTETIRNEVNAVVHDLVEMDTQEEYGELSVTLIGHER